MLCKEMTQKFEHYIFKLNDKVRVCKEGLDELFQLKSSYSNLLDKFTNKLEELESNTIDQIAILGDWTSYEKVINENQEQISNFCNTSSKDIS